jgi:hypothetical protein
MSVGKRMEDIIRGPRPFAIDYSNGSQQYSGSCTASASANTKGSYSTIDADAPLDADGFWLYLMPHTANRDYHVDIAIGGAGSEVNILENIQISSAGASGFLDSWEVYVPLPIRGGTRISARCAASTGSAVISVGFRFVKSELTRAQRMGRATTYGAAVGDSGGTAIDPGASADTLGAWAEITASLTRRIRGYALLSIGNKVNSARTAGSLGVQFGIGGAGSEVAVTGVVQIQAEATSDLLKPVIRGINIDLPAGVRLAARGISQTNDATDRLFEVVVIGFD